MAAGFDAAASPTLASGGFATGRLTVYPLPDLALTGGAALHVGRVHGLGTIEYQPTLGRVHNLAFFVNGAAGDNRYYAITAGLRFYFGPDKPLIRRHREDDPAFGIVDEQTYDEGGQTPRNCPTGCRFGD